MDVNKLQAICESLDAYAEDYKNGFEQDLKLERLIAMLTEKRQSANKKWLSSPHTLTPLSSF